LRTPLFDTDVILLDEPFGASTPRQAQDAGMVGQLWSDFARLSCFVTHDVEEAIISPTRST
jgi:ABC-type nitrate/sulfonate/bicarbonate transport system ATPase subunit